MAARWVELIAPRKPSPIRTTRGLLPFLCGRQPVRQACLGAKPLAVCICCCPVYPCNGMIEQLVSWLVAVPVPGRQSPGGGHETRKLAVGNRELRDLEGRQLD